MTTNHTSTIFLFLLVASTAACSVEPAAHKSINTSSLFAATTTTSTACDTGRTGTIDVINYPAAPAAEYPELPRNIATILRKCFGCHNSGSPSARMRNTQLGTFNRARGVFDWGTPPRAADTVYNRIIGRLDLRATPGGAENDAEGRMPRLLHISAESDLARDLTAAERTALRAWMVARRDALAACDEVCCQYSYGDKEIMPRRSCVEIQETTVLAISECDPAEEEADTCCVSTSCDEDGEPVVCEDCEDDASLPTPACSSTTAVSGEFEAGPD
jgi:hypothetical protein